MDTCVVCGKRIESKKIHSHAKKKHGLMKKEYDIRSIKDKYEKLYRAFRSQPQIVESFRSTERFELEMVEFRNTKNHRSNGKSGGLRSKIGGLKKRLFREKKKIKKVHKKKK